MSTADNNENRTPLLQMKFQVFFIVAFFVEPFTTDSALHSPNTSMNGHMIISVLGFTECLCTNLTMIPDTCVFIHMNFEIRLMVISFPTQFAVVSKLASTILHMCAQVCCSTVHFIGSVIVVLVVLFQQWHSTCFSIFRFH